MSYGKYKPLITSPSFSITEKELKYLEDNFDYSPGFIKNIGEEMLYTIFWINEAFDVNNPDTYFEVV